MNPFLNRHPKTSLKSARQQRTVLFDTRQKNFHQNPYIADLVEAVEEWKIVGFSWRRALFGKYDVLHVHWPEWLVRHSRSWLSPIMRALTRLLLLRVRIWGIPVVRTVHNLTPHSRILRTEANLIESIDSLAGVRVWLIDPPESSRSETDLVIPHPDYEPWRQRFGIQVPNQPGNRAGLCLGSLVPYRNFEEVIAAFADHGEATLVVAGAPSDSAYSEALALLALDAATRIRLQLGRLSDTDLAKMIGASDVLFIPYKDLYNSGILFLSLTLRRPVALPNTPIARRLRQEFGPEWIRIWDGELDAAKVERILSNPSPSQPPRMERRSWNVVGSQHDQAYSLAARGGRRISFGETRCT